MVGASLLALIACGDGKRGGSSGGASDSYMLCDGSDDVRLGWSSAGGQVESTYEFTNPYGHAFLFIDGHCHYYASESWLKGVVQGELSPAEAKQIQQKLLLTDIARLAYHDAESCPDAGAFWLRAADGYVDCTCGCDEKAPHAAQQALDQAGMLAAALTMQGAALDGPIALIALDEGKPTGSNANLPAWPLIWPLSDISVEWEAYTRGTRPSPRLLLDAEASAARMLKATVLRENQYAGAVRVTDLGKAYNLFMREELPDSVRDAIARFVAE